MRNFLHFNILLTIHSNLKLKQRKKTSIFLQNEYFPNKLNFLIDLFPHIFIQKLMLQKKLL